MLAAPVKAEAWGDGRSEGSLESRAITAMATVVGVIGNMSVRKSLPVNRRTRGSSHLQHEAWERHEREEAYMSARAYGYGSGYGYRGRDDRYEGRGRDRDHDEIATTMEIATGRRCKPARAS